MNIAIDATYSVGANLSGVGVYSRRILEGVSTFCPGSRFLFCYRPHRLTRSLSERLPSNARRAVLRSGGIAPWRCALFHALNQRLDTRFAPTVATFHDLFVLTGEYSSPEFRARFAEQARSAAEKADLLIAVSRFTAEQIVALLRVERSRIRVIHHGAGVPVYDPPPDGDRENIVLHVGAIQARKNVSRLVEAFERMPAGWRLVFAGSTGGYGAGEILPRIEASARRADIQLSGYVDGPALEALYRRARILAFPSLDEGFGMPVLDAMARGVPVLTSNRSALPEIAGDAALLVDPLDTEAIADGLVRLSENACLRHDLRNRGLMRVAGFQWESAVQRTWSVYKELIGDRNV